MNTKFECIREKISNKEIFSLFILNWNNIYEIDETGYRKDMIHFNNEEEYKLFIDNIKNKISSGNKDFLDVGDFIIYIENYNSKEYVNIVRK